MDYNETKSRTTNEPKFDREAIMTAVKMLLKAIGDNPDREGLIGTPDRVARAFEEMFEGMAYTDEEIVEMFRTTFSSNSKGLVTITDIPIFSTCEHHLMLMYDMKVHIGYIPNGTVIGLSKAARIAEMVGHRLQLQERITEQIADIMSKVLNTPDIIVVVEGRHGCMEARGVKAKDSKTRTAVLRGLFNANPVLRNEFYSLIKA